MFMAGVSVAGGVDAQYFDTTLIAFIFAQGLFSHLACYYHANPLGMFSFLSMQWQGSWRGAERGLVLIANRA